MEEIQKKINVDSVNRIYHMKLVEEAKHSDKSINDFMKMFPKVELLDETHSLDYVFKQKNVSRWYSEETDEVYQEHFWPDQKEEKKKKTKLSQK